MRDMIRDRIISIRRTTIIFFLTAQYTISLLVVTVHVSRGYSVVGFTIRQTDVLRFKAGPT